MWTPRHTTAVTEVGRMALESRDVAALMVALTDVVAAAAGADWCWVGLVTGARRDLLAAVGSSGVPAADRRDEVRIGPVSGAALTAGEVVVSPAAPSTDGTLAAEELLPLGARSAAAAAVPGSGGARGVLAIAAGSGEAFAPEDVVLLRLVATLLGVAIDRADREADAVHRATHDVLTGLPNRAALHAQLRGRRERGARTALAVLDLDGFKLVNDSFGHGAGDDLLRAVADRLLEAVAHAALVARLGGDEFAVLLGDAEAHAGRALRLVREAVRALAAPFALAEATVQVGASAGLALGDPSRARTDLLRDADVALYDAKARGGGTVSLFRPELRRAAQRRLAVESGLRAALDQHRLVVHFQPIVDLRDGRPVELEALARWTDPRLGAVAPAEFVPAAERAGLASALGRAVRRAAAAAARRTGLPVAVNVATSELVAPGFAEGFVRDARAGGVEPDRLRLELTESNLLADVARGLPVLERLRAVGVRLALDDFGTGASSLTRLRELPFDVLKIDRSFIAAAAPGARGWALVEAALALAGAFELDAVAEGIEHEAHTAALLAAGCRFGQGFLFAHPAPLDDLVLQ